MHLVIVGGSDAGISAALRAREIDPDIRISLLLADDFPNFSICGLPYYLGGETPDWHDLAHRTEFPGIDILHRHRALSIDAAAKTIEVEHDGRTGTMGYDRLVIATGAAPALPDIPGAERDGVYLLQTMRDSFAIHRHLTERAPRKAVVIGGGYIGLEMAEALTTRGLDVTLLSRTPTVHPTVDAAFGGMVADELRGHGVRVETGVGATRIDRGADTALSVMDTTGATHPTDLVILAVGVRPASDLAGAAGARLGTRGAIAVNRRMETSLPDVLAAGDCVETYHRLLGERVYISLGTLSHKQGRVAGENAVGGDRMFAGALGTQSLKVFDLVIARTGLLDGEARDAGFDPFTVVFDADDHKAYYPGSVRLHLRITGDRNSGRLLGAQILGRRTAEISKRIDIVATALFQEATVEDLNDLDLSYTPPLSSPWDPIQMAAQAWGTAVAMAARSDVGCGDTS
ncbi:FAD-dependent oxidoreductase [Methylobacterium sp. C25]|uniref:FAD-dependent oxidoreductase n=1 Tax=Methylobacterium sp. C25 TaxID=2721622 RepID=UPI001F33F01B|nr:FAD-dependent oxidoreductase [Methylobacterium sp. C25]MCE4226256.1 FAD-dependent oxidoreductase [Methylobacterium sp. C25]